MMPVSRFLAAGLCAVIAGLTAPGAAQDPAHPLGPGPSAAAPWPDELVLEGDHTIIVAINGLPVRLKVGGDASGPIVINPETAARLGLVPNGRRGWRFGPEVISGQSDMPMVDFGAGPVAIPVAWADRPVVSEAEGNIGVHLLPYARVTLRFGKPQASEQVHSFPLTRTGGRNNARVGTEVGVGKRKLTILFTPERPENLITAPTANFLATHREGGFVRGSSGIANMDFGVRRPTRTMRLAMPLMLGELALAEFAVRVEDYGNPSRVGEIAEGDPRFDPRNILVSRRKGKGKPDLLTRIGRNQIAHCSAITYDLENSAIGLSCGEPAL